MTADYRVDFTTLPPTCTPRCNPGMHDLIGCETPHVDPPQPVKPRRTGWDGVIHIGALGHRSLDDDEDGETDDRLSDARAEQEYGGRDAD